MFQSVYLPLITNHIFDITTGVGASSGIYGSVTNQKSKKLNIYNQMAQVLMGYDHLGAVQRLMGRRILAGGNKLENVLLISSLLTMTKSKKALSLKLGATAYYLNVKLLEITDASI